MTEYLDPRSILASLSRSELERVVRERLDEGDEELGEIILGLKAEKSDARSPSTIVDAVMRRHKSQGYDYIEDAYGFGRDLLRLRDRAADAAAKGDYLFAVRLLSRAIERAAPHAYDGGGDEESPIMDAVEEGFERLSELARASDAGPAALRELGAWAAQGVEARWARDGDSWDMACLALVAEAARGEDAVRATLELCSRFTDNPQPAWEWSYRAGRAALVAAGLMSRVGDMEGRRAYIEAQLALDDIRKLAIDEAMAAEDYPRVAKLCRDGARLAREAGRGGAANEFEERLIEALDRAGAEDEATGELERLVMESFRVDRFEALKGRYSGRESWAKARDRIIAALEGEGGSAEALAVVFEAEGMVERLLALAEKHEFVFSRHLDAIGRAYPERAARFLKARIEDELRRTGTRGSYERDAESILRYGGFAGKEAAEALFDSLIASYPSRRAMREEFERAKRRGSRY